VLYCIALMDFSKEVKNVNLVWHYVRAGMDVPFSFTKDELEAHKANIIKTYRKILAEEFPLGQSNNCVYCDFRTVCPATSHAEKVLKLPEKEFKKDDGVKLVDKLTKLISEQKELTDKACEYDEKITELKQEIFDYSKKFNVSSIVGSEKQAKISVSKEPAFPGKNDPKTVELTEKIKKLGLWDKLSVLDPYKLKSFIKEKELDEKTENEILKFAEEKEIFRVTLGKLKEEKG
jgi:hypothetical protein